MNGAESQALLDQLREVQAPDVSAWPAIGWWLALCCLLLMILFASLAYRRHLSRRWRREAELELRRLRNEVASRPVNQTLADCSQLARRVLMVVHRREDVASLEGQGWLEALDAVCQQPLFAKGFGRLLESAPYQRNPNINQNDLESLFDSLEELIRSAARKRSNTVSS